MSCNYIYIYKGDDTDWNDEQLITVNVTSGSPLVDLTDMTATFILGSYEKKNISLESGSFQIDLGAAVTGDFPYGAIMGVIKILDSQKRVRTVANMIPFYVTNEVITLQNQNLVIDVPQVSINLTVGGTVNYNNLSNKPSINGLTVEGAHDSAYYDLATKTALDAHIADVNNPHEVTKAQVGLGNVDNTADADKPISTATQSALNTKMPLAGGTFTGNVAFANGTKIEFPTFDIYNDDGLAIIEGNYGLRVDTTSGLGAVLKTVNGIEKILTDKDVKSTYSATGTDPVNGTAVASAISTKQDNLTTAQLAAVNSGIDSTKVAQIATNTTDISTINGKIPSQASSTNQLADKNFVNSSIATNTANFIGTFNSVAELEAYSGTLTNNDYAFVVGTDGDGNTVYDRYKYTTATTPASWVFEYELNNSSFTAAQWAAINSGATSTNIGQIATNTSDISSLQSNKLDVTTAASTYLTQTDAANTYLTQSSASSTYLTQTSAASTYATQNALSTGLAAKQDTLTAGTGISIVSNVISATGATPDNVFTTDNLTGGQNITITNDGPATTTVTDFDNGCIAIPWVNPTSSLELIVHGKMPSSYTSGQNYGLLEAGTGLAIQKYSNDGTQFKSWAYDENLSAIWENQDIANYYAPSTEFWLKILWDGTKYSFWYKNADVWTKYGSDYSSSSAIYNASDKLYLGQYYATGRTTQNMKDGEIYLHDCSLSVDGNVVFDGTTAVQGTDYTVIGTPTITTEGGGGYKINCVLEPSLTWYSGTRGNTLTIADTSAANLVKIYKNGILMQESADYTISGTTLTMDVSLVETDKIALEVI